MADTRRVPVYRMFGLTVSSELPLWGLRPLDSQTAAEVQLRSIRLDEMRERFATATGPSRTLSLGWGETVEMIEASVGVFLRYEDKAWFWVSADGTAVLYGARDEARADWRIVLMDTVLGTAALCRGREGLHAAAVELEGGVVAITAASGGGKTTLCAELIRRGGRLFADDLLFLRRADRHVLAEPGPPLMSIGPGADGVLGEVVATVAGHTLVVVPGAARDAAPLVACLVLDRNDEIEGARLELEPSPVALLQAALLSGTNADRRRGRFELLADLLQGMTLFRLVANAAMPATELALLVESAVDLARAG